MGTAQINNFHHKLNQLPIVDETSLDCSGCLGFRFLLVVFKNGDVPLWSETKI